MVRINLLFAVLLGTVLLRYSSCCKSNDVAMDKFKEFASKYNKTYRGPEEFQKRFKIFADKLKEIERLNEEARGLTAYGINEFSDLSWDEFKTNLLVSQPPTANATSSIPRNVIGPNLLRRPSAVDWRSYMTPIKHQGGCYSCWAFATTAVVEFQVRRWLGWSNPLSEQHLLDCSSAGNCSGGFFEPAFEYARDTGLYTQSSYPYRESQASCRPPNSPSPVKLVGIERVSSDEHEMASVVADVGPIVVYFQVARSFEMYRGGILMDTGCGNSKNFHGVAVVGFGESNGQPYWIGRNSWGTSWGEQGYFRIPRGINWCGWATAPISGWIKKPF